MSQRNMRTKMSMVALAGLIGCAGHAPPPARATAPPVSEARETEATETEATEPLPSTAQLSLSGLPNITLPHSPHTVALQEALASAETMRSHEPGDDASVADWRAWAAAGVEALHDVERIGASLGDSVEARVTLVLATLLREQLIYRSRRGQSVYSTQQLATRDRALESCVALGESDTRLAPWTHRCAELIAYWRADAAWHAGPVWPEACPPRHGGWSEEPMNPTALGRPALVLHVDSELSQRDEARLAEAVVRALRVQVPDADVVSASEQEAAEQAFIRMRSPDGHACALPPSPDAQLVSAHPRLWSVEVDARCRRHEGGHCALVVFTRPIAGSAEGMPHGLETVLENTRPTIGDLEEAASRLTRGVEALQMNSASRCNGYGGHVLPPSLCGESAAFDDDELDAALAPIRPALQSCGGSDFALSGGFEARLDVARDGRVAAVRITGIPGARRIACLERGLRRARFPARSAVVVVSGFEMDAPVDAEPAEPPPTRERFDEDYRDWFQPGVISRLEACVGPESPVLIVDGTLHIARNGITSRVDGDATDATSVCVRNALVGSVWPCSGERDIAMRLCIGQPEAPTEPVRP